MCCCLQALVGAAAQISCDKTRQKVWGNSWKERAEPAVEPQLDEGGVIEPDGVQSDFSYGVQYHCHCRIPGVKSLGGKKKV